MKRVYDIIVAGVNMQDDLAPHDRMEPTTSSFRFDEQNEENESGEEIRASTATNVAAKTVLTSATFSGHLQWHTL